MSRKNLTLSAAAALLCLAAALWWFFSPLSAQWPEAYRVTATDHTDATPTQSNAPTPAVLPQERANEALASTVDDAFLSGDLRHVLEAMLLEATGDSDTRDLAATKKRLLTLIPRYFPAQHAGRATALTDRYMDYRVALGGLKPPTDPSDPRALRAALDARQQARTQHFTSQEYDALFAQEARLDRYTVARLEIERNTGLTAPQKQAALKDAEHELSTAQRAERDQATAHLFVANQTAGFDAQGTTDTERYAQRRALHGDAAAARFAELDREEQNWQMRLNQYAAAKAGQASVEQLQQLRQQLFSEQEQVRVDVALDARP